MKKIICCIMALTMCLGIFTSCGNEKAEETTAAVTETTAEPTTEAPLDEKTNLLTGNPTLSKGAIGKRPVAVMINNIRQSLPQYGIAAADILFEIEVEGGITRMMAVYGDYTKIPNVCSIRSCRYYFPIFAAGFDAIYLCYGCNETLGAPTLKRLNIDYIDGNDGNPVFGRDQERLQSYSLEHTAYLKGEKVPETLKSEGMRTEINDRTPFFNFNESAKKLSKTKSEKAVLDFSEYYYSTFEYDAQTKTYVKYHNGTEHMDQTAGKQLSFTNVIILTTSVKSYKKTILREVNWKGGNGYILSRGTVKKIKWSKADEMSRIILTDVNGREISINKGKSYIGVLNPGDVHLTVVKPETTSAAVS
ncbi:MAG: DUF3048 domain-containing protein [Clostridia bacterium]|nr:DUF3048 domain-containing protein [Clostridia bacterium]